MEILESILAHSMVQGSWGNLGIFYAPQCFSSSGGTSVKEKQ